MRSPTLLLAALVALTGCATNPAGETAPSAPAAAAAPRSEPFPSTYRPLPSVPTLIAGAVVLTGTGERLDGVSLLMVDGRIAAIGRDLEAPAGARVIDAAGRWVTPGLIDVHSHLGVHASPGVDAHSDTNEMTSPVTAEVWAEHGVWPQDPGFVTALAGGVTSLQVLPGSTNLIGGRGVTLKNVPSRTAQGMKFPGAPYGLKMACGENPKRLYGGRGRSPMTRMGNVAGYREAWIRAEEYRRERQEWDERRAGGRVGTDEGGRGGRRDQPPRRDLAMETLVGVLDGEILVHNHCYRADEMAQMIDLAGEFGYRITAFHHGVEAYKVADLLADNGICGALWADWWGFKMEAFDGVRENVALVDAVPGGCAIVHSDSDLGIQRLNQEAAKAMAAAERAGLAVPRERAIRWITANAARSLGIDDVTGSLEAGKNADVVLWNGDPFSVYALADQVWIDGALVWDREDPARQPRSDFSVGLLPDEPFSPGPPPAAAARPAAAAAAAATVAPAAVPAPALLDGETVAITGATVHTAGAAGTLADATVLIAAGRIAAVGRDLPVPPGARVIDGRGRIVTPGLFDSLSRLGVVEVGAVAGSRDTATDDGRVTAAFRVIDAFNPESTLLAVTRVEGLTRALVAPATGSSPIAGEAAVVHLGSGSDPVVAAPVAIVVALGERGARLAGGSRAAALLTLREALEDARDFAAHRGAWARGERRDYSLSRLDLEALVPVVEGRLPLVVSVDRASDIRAVLALAAEQGLRLVIAGGAEAWRLADEIAAAGVPVLVDPLANLPASFESLGAALDNAARLHAAGVTVALASQTAHNARNLRQAAGNAVAHGLPRDVALAAMTSVPAAIWGLADHYGTVEAGREADVVVWDGDPLEVTSYPLAVFVRGREMPADSRQLRLRDRYRELPAPGELPVAYPRAH